MSPQTGIYLEIGARRVFAGAVEWPGWCRSGRTEEAAIQALLEYGPRYAAVLRGRIRFSPPKDESTIEVAERLKGDATTDFGAPSKSPREDRMSVGSADVQRLRKILEACWMAFESATKAASGKKLRKGPRGGGRELHAIAAHVVDADASYLRQIGGTFKRDERADLTKEAARLRAEILDTWSSRARGEPPPENPRRRAKLWTPRYFVRRSAWHALDHAWEIEDRATSPTRR